MKERRKFIGKVKKVVKKAGIGVILTALFIAGYLVSWNFLIRPMNDDQFEVCEQIARDVYAKKGDVIVEVPDGYFVSKTTTTITVEPANIPYHGKVTARLQNGELVITQNTEIAGRIGLSMLIGIIFLLVSILIWAIISIIRKKIKQK